MKCKRCRFALPLGDIRAWAPARTGSPLYNAQIEAYRIGGYVCTGDFTVHPPLEKGSRKKCKMYQRGIEIFGG